MSDNDPSANFLPDTNKVADLSKSAFTGGSSFIVFNAFKTISEGMVFNCDRNSSRRISFSNVNKTVFGINFSLIKIVSTDEDDVKQQHINKKSAKATAQVIDNRKVIPVEPTPVANNGLVRTVFYVEVGDMEPLRVQLLIQEINRTYVNARGGAHYVVPVRRGKLGSEVMFEQEFLSVVYKMCEIRDGQIVLKGDAANVQVIRESI